MWGQLLVRESGLESRKLRQVDSNAEKYLRLTKRLGKYLRLTMVWENTCTWGWIQSGKVPEADWKKTLRLTNSIDDWSANNKGKYLRLTSSLYGWSANNKGKYLRLTSSLYDWSANSEGKYLRLTSSLYGWSAGRTGCTGIFSHVLPAVNSW